MKTIYTDTIQGGFAISAFINGGREDYNMLFIDNR